MKLPKGMRAAAKEYLYSNYSKEDAKEILRQTGERFNSFIQEEPAPGGLNVLRSQYYGGLSIFALYEVLNGEINDSDLQEILWSMLLKGGNIHRKTRLPIRLSGTWLQRMLYKMIGWYANFVDKKLTSGKWKNTWRICVNPENYKNGISVPLTGCPVARFAEKHKLSHLMPIFCGSDFKVAEKYGIKLIRRHTEEEGFPNCDFWYLMEQEEEA